MRWERRVDRPRSVGAGRGKIEEAPDHVSEPVLPADLLPENAPGRTGDRSVFMKCLVGFLHTFMGGYELPMNNIRSLGAELPQTAACGYLLRL